jgi:hypothetical protein
MHYTPDGRFAGAERLPDARLAEYRRYRDLARENAVPFAAYEPLGSRSH